MSRHTFKWLTILNFILCTSIFAQNLNKIITIQILPKKITLKTGQTQRFVARGFNRYNKEVPFSPEWSAVGGKIDQSGWFRAGARPGVYTVMATDRRTGAQGSAAVMIKYTNYDSTVVQRRQKITRLSIYPKKVFLNSGESVYFKVSAYNAANEKLHVAFQLLWKVSGGSINTSGVYRAGGAPGSYLVRVKEPNGVMTTAEVIIRGGVKVSSIKIFPSNTKLRPFMKKRFFATAYNSSGQIVKVRARWVATGGSIDENGVYTAGDNPGKFFVKAIAPGDISSTAQIKIEQAKIKRIQVFPENVILYPGQLQKFKVKAFNRAGKSISVPFPLWSATGGIIQMDGTYQAGKVPGKYTLNVTVGKVTITRNIVIKKGAEIVKLRIHPRKATLQPGQKIKFDVTATNNRGESVGTKITWEAYGGKVDSSGVYTAGNSLGAYVVIANVDDLSTKAVVVIRRKPQIQDVKWITIKPSKIRLAKNQSIKFLAKAFDQSGKRVKCKFKWSTNGGEITSDGTYVAGSKNGIYQVTASVSSGIKANAIVIVGKKRTVVKKPIKNIRKRKPFRIFRWRMGHGTDLIGKVYIKGRVYSQIAHVIKLVLVRTNGSEKILYQMRIKKGQRFEFRGSYVRSNTESVAVVLLDDEYVTLKRVQKDTN